MLTKNFYDDLHAVAKLPGCGYKENERPASLSGNHERFLLQCGYLEYLTLVPPNKEPKYPDGYYMIAVSPYGHYALSVYAEQILKERRELRQFRITTALAVLSIPGILNGLLDIADRIGLTNWIKLCFFS